MRLLPSGRHTGHPPGWQPLQLTDGQGLQKMNLAHYCVVDLVRWDPELFGLVRSGIIFLDPRPDTTILTGQFLERLIFFSWKNLTKKNIFLQMFKSIFSIFNLIFNTWIQIRNRIRIRILTEVPDRATKINAYPDAALLPTHKLCNCFISQELIRKTE